MFETATLSYGNESKRVFGTFAGIAGQALLVTCAVITPMVSPAMLPRAVWITTLSAPGPPPPPPQLGPRIRPKNAGPIPSQVSARSVIAPGWIPPKARIIVDDAPDVTGGGFVEGGISGGDRDGVAGGIVSSIIDQARPVAPVVRAPDPMVTNVARPAATVVKPPRISVLELGHPISRVDPIYPPLARQMRLSGVVELQGVLGTDGRIHELKVLRGHPMLVRAAVDAVSQWIWAPTILNGQAVEVVAPIIVTFRLNQ